MNNVAIVTLHGYSNCNKLKLCFARIKKLGF